MSAVQIRETDDPIEREGVTRAQARAAAADLVLWVVDAADQDGFAAPPAAAKVFVVRNKIDRVAQHERTKGAPADFAVSSTSGEGLDRLLEAITAFAAETAPKPGMSVAEEPTRSCGARAEFRFEAEGVTALNIGHLNSRDIENGDFAPFATSCGLYPFRPCAASKSCETFRRLRGLRAAAGINPLIFKILWVHRQNPRTY